jgi:hypothetical protein
VMLQYRRELDREELNPVCITCFWNSRWNTEFITDNLTWGKQIIALVICLAHIVVKTNKINPCPINTLLVLKLSTFSIKNIIYDKILKTEYIFFMVHNIHMWVNMNTDNNNFYILVTHSPVIILICHWDYKVMIMQLIW